MIQAAWIGVDWGTSNMRAYAMDKADTCFAEAASDSGLSQLKPAEFEFALAEMIAPWRSREPITVIASGMVGSRQGWLETPYMPVPCNPGTPKLSRAPGSDPSMTVWITPGISQSAPPDVMRGEETQIAGFLANDPGFDGILCMPGTHTKWVRISAQEIVSFTTFMTGEIFGLLSSQSILKHSLASDDLPHAPFLEAVSDAISKPHYFASRLFSLRAASLLEGLAPATARARLSGTLIGTELAAARPYWLGMDICVIGAPAIAQLYCLALEAQGAAPQTASVEDTTLGGLRTAYNHIKEQQ